MSWLGKGMWAKVEKNTFSSFSRDWQSASFQSAVLHPRTQVFVHYRPNQHLLRFWRSLHLPEGTTTQQAPGWPSHPTAPPPSPPRRRRHCQVIARVTIHLEKPERFHSYLHTGRSSKSWSWTEKRPNILPFSYLLQINILRGQLFRLVPFARIYRFARWSQEMSRYDDITRKHTALKFPSQQIPQSNWDSWGFQLHRAQLVISLWNQTTLRSEGHFSDGWWNS